MDEGPKEPSQPDQNSHLDYVSKMANRTSSTSFSLPSFDDGLGAGQSCIRFFTSAEKFNMPIDHQDDNIMPRKHVMAHQGRDRHETDRTSDEDTSVEKDASPPISVGMKDISKDRTNTEQKAEDSQGLALCENSKVIAKLKTTNKQLKKSITKYKEETREEIEDLKIENAELKQECLELEERLHDVQKEMLARSKKDPFDAMPDDEVQNELKCIFATGRGLAKIVAGLLYVDRDDDKRKLMLPTLLGQEGKNAPASSKGLKAAYDNTISVRQVLMARLAHDLARMFASPFFYLEIFQTGGRWSKEVELLLSLQKLGTESSEKMQHQWRALTVRMLNEKLKADTDSKADCHVQALKNDAYAKFADAYLRQCKLILPESYRQRASMLREEVMKLFHRAGQLACRLHGQYVKVVVLFSPQQVGNFSVDSRFMEAHNTMDIEQGDDEWNGKPIDLVIQPAIIAYGNERGENYDEFKVWSKAVVWMTEEQRVEFHALRPVPKKNKLLGSQTNKDIGSVSKVSVLKEAIMVPDDDEDEHSIKGNRRGNDEPKEMRRLTRRPQEGGKAKQEATTASSYRTQEQEHDGRAFSRQSSNVEVAIEKSQVHEQADVRAPLAKRAGDKVVEEAKHAQLAQSQKIEEVKGAPDVDAKNQAEPSTKRRQHGCEDSFSQQSSKKSRAN